MARFASRAPWALALLLTLGGTSCQVSAPAPAAVPQQAHALQGQIVVADRAVSALISDVANGATVSLIDGTTGTTVASAVSTPTGAFALNLAAIAPVASRPYFLEAAKGLPAGGSAQRAGSSVARLRTLLFYQGGDWVSLNSGQPGDPVLIGWASTAVAAIASLKGLTATDQANLVGKVSSNGQSFDPTATAISSAEFVSVYRLVDTALRNDQDPWAAIGYDANSGSFGSKPAGLVLNPGTTPAKTAPGGTITVTGQNLPSPRTGVSVTVGNLPASWTVNADHTQMTLTIPSNGYSGVLRIAQGTSQWSGPFIPVSGTVGTLAGSGIAGYLDGPGNLAQFYTPHGVALDAAGNVYVSETGNNRVRKVAPDGTVTTLAGNGTQADVDGTGTAASFKSPVGICIDSNGYLYVPENVGYLIRKVSPAGVVTTLAGSGTGTWADGTGAAASFYGPYGTACDASNNVYVADCSNYRIRKITPAGVVTTLAGSGTNGWADGDPATAQFSGISDLAVDAAGNVYVADRGNHRIRKVTPSGTVSTLAGSGTGTWADGTGTSASFKEPTGVDVDAAGNVYVMDASNHRIRKVTPGGVVTTIAGSGVAGYKDGPALQAQFYDQGDPGMLAVAPNGFIYFVDIYQPHVRVYVP